MFNISDLSALIDSPSQDPPKLYSDFRARNREALHESSSALEQTRMLSQQNQDLLERWEEDLKSFHTEKTSLVAEIRELERENKMLLGKVIEQSKRKFAEVRQVKQVSASKITRRVRRKVKGGEGPVRESEIVKDSKKSLKLSWLKDVIADLYQCEKFKLLLYVRVIHSQTLLYWRY